MLKTMWSRLPCSHDALSSVHQAPCTNTGYAPLIPNSSSARRLGASSDIMPPPTICSSLPEASSVRT